MSYTQSMTAAHSASSTNPNELRLEGVLTCVGFDDVLDVTLGLNHAHFDTLIVVTSYDDKKTQQVAKKHSATCVPTDLFSKNDRAFNKGAAINAGMARFQYHGWRLHLDVDNILPDNFRRVLFNHTHLDTRCIYGADRVDVVGKAQLADLRGRLARQPQSFVSYLVQANHDNGIGARYVDLLRGYVPIGFFQLWHASEQKEYPWSKGEAQHDDIMFAEMWPRPFRHLLPSVVCYHLLCEQRPWGNEWDGVRKQQRLS